jgi:hypothetical protein
MKGLLSLPIGTLVSPTVSNPFPIYAISMMIGGVGPSPSTIGALVSSTSIIRSSGIVHLNRSELWYRPPQSFGALVSSTSIIGGVGEMSSSIGGAGTLSPHWLARVYPPASPRVDLVRVHSPSDPVMTSHIGLALHYSFISLLDPTATTTTTMTNDTITTQRRKCLLT